MTGLLDRQYHVRRCGCGVTLCGDGTAIQLRKDAKEIKAAHRRMVKLVATSDLGTFGNKMHSDSSSSIKGS